jgi:hypothetical protein
MKGFRSNSYLPRKASTALSNKLSFKHKRNSFCAVDRLKSHNARPNGQSLEYFVYSPEDDQKLNIKNETLSFISHLSNSIAFERNLSNAEHDSKAIHDEIFLDDSAIFAQILDESSVSNKFDHEYSDSHLTKIHSPKNKYYNQSYNWYNGKVKSVVETQLGSRKLQKLIQKGNFKREELIGIYNEVSI